MSAENEEKASYLKDLTQGMVFRKSIERRFPKTSPAMRQLLESLLEINQERRKSAAELLKHEAFSTTKNPAQMLTIDRISLSTDFDFDP